MATMLPFTSYTPHSSVAVSRGMRVTGKASSRCCSRRARSLTGIGGNCRTSSMRSIFQPPLDAAGSGTINCAAFTASASANDNVGGGGIELPCGAYPTTRSPNAEAPALPTAPPSALPRSLPPGYSAGGSGRRASRLTAPLVLFLTMAPSACPIFAAMYHPREVARKLTPVLLSDQPERPQRSHHPRISPATTIGVKQRHLR